MTHLPRHTWRPILRTCSQSLSMSPSHRKRFLYRRLRVSKIHQAPGAFVSCNTTKGTGLLVKSRIAVSHLEGGDKVSDNFGKRK